HLFFRIPLYKAESFAYYYLPYSKESYDAYVQWGLAHLVRQYPGLWLNRSPYLLFNDFGGYYQKDAPVPYGTTIQIERDKDKGFKCKEPVYSPLTDPAWQKPTLELVKPVDPGTIQMICDRLHFYASLGD